MIEYKPGSQVLLNEHSGIDGHYSGWITRIDGMDFYIDVIVGDEIVPTHHYATEFISDKRPTCKGSIALGSGCRKCDSCYRQIKDGIQPLATTSPEAERELKRELRTRWAWKKIGEVICVGMEGNLDTVHDATLKITGGWLSSYSNGDEAAILLAKHLVNQHNKDIPS